MMKKCKKCNVIKPHKDFHSEKRNKDGKRGVCRLCYNAEQNLKYIPKPVIVLTKEERLLKRAKSNSKYWKTENGKLMLTYNNMKRRVDGYVKPHLYGGLDICERHEFYEWSKNNIDFKYLFDEWSSNGFIRKISPSIDRIDTSLGYIVDNMQWITHSENSKKGSISRHNL